MNETLTKLKLIARTKSGRDPRGQVQYTETARDIYGRDLPITREEYYKAGQIGLEPERAFIISAFDYKGEQLAEVNGQKYRIYRIYPRDANETEIYLIYASGANAAAITGGA